MAGKNEAHKNGCTSSTPWLSLSRSPFSLLKTFLKDYFWSILDYVQEMLCFIVFLLDKNTVHLPQDPTEGYYNVMKVRMYHYDHQTWLPGDLRTHTLTLSSDHCSMVDYQIAVNQVWTATILKLHKGNTKEFSSSTIFLPLNIWDKDDRKHYHKATATVLMPLDNFFLLRYRRTNIFATSRKS